MISHLLMPIQLTEESNALTVPDKRLGKVVSHRALQCRVLKNAQKTPWAFMKFLRF